MLKNANFAVLRFAVLNPCFVFSSFHPLFVISQLFFFFFFFCITCEMPTYNPPSYKCLVAQSAGAAEYTDCISAEE